MFKRANNITSLLVAVATIVSLVPVGVSAADVKTIDAKEGTIDAAVSFSNGSYYLDAEIDGKDEAVYYVSPDGKYNELPSGTSSKGNDIEQGSTASSFAGKYARINNNDMYLADYTVDMTTGTITDTDAKEDMVDAVGRALKGQIKDADDRYASPKTVKTYADKTLTRKAGNYFFTKYQANTTEKEYTPDQAGIFNVYCDINGNYIDGDYNLGKIKVETTTAGSVTINNTKDSEDIKGGTVSASLSNIVNIDHDKDNFYRWATITVSSTTPIAKINGVEIIDESSNNDKTKVSYNVLQKLSKASASDEIDGAKYPQTVTNYALADKDGVAVEGIDGNMITGNYFISNGKISVYTLYWRYF